ncbi:hypothetical protein CHS0354_010661 [Potamilus streckersoni]|uniref:Sushi domain-containing protein n=1 Tax=Potamilus streckersoni TaxID=2493646 RepID=A0AAE0TDD1_9BIVA|nr:hypothetical protein CHS0354_010661 [Potamilus streckersoni]
MANENSVNVVRCDEILQPNNSDIFVHEGINGTWTYNTTVSISCIEGYILDGESHVRCKGTKMWTGSIGRCDKRADSVNSLESGSIAAASAGGGAGGVCVVVLGIVIGVILYRRKKRPQAKTTETAFDDIPSLSKKMIHDERGNNPNGIYGRVELTVDATPRLVHTEIPRLPPNNNLTKIVHVQQDLFVKDRRDLSKAENNTNNCDENFQRSK